MGLDMYLNAKRYLWRIKEEEQAIAQKIGDTVNSNGMRVKEVVCEAMYWRKANAIHYWFVQNVQDGSDDCREYYVPRKKLEALVGVCVEVLADPNKADDLLPTADGFFLGSDQTWYWADVKETIDTISRLLENTSAEWEFYYASSW